MNCRRCGYASKNKCDLKSHLQRKNICIPLLEDVDINILYNEHFEKKNKNYTCDYCDKTYSYLSGKSFHMKNCSKKIEFELLQTNQLDTLKKQLEYYKKKSIKCQLDELHL
jgi:NADH:ubiquinone oxidoreductase subunit E